MKLRLPARFSLTAALLLAPAIASAEEGYVLAKKGNVPEAGIVRTEKIISDLSDSTIELKRDDQHAKGIYTYKVSASVVIEGLAAGKARRTLTSKTTEERAMLGGREQLTPDKGDSLQGVPVLVEYKDGSWVAKLEAGEADADQKTSLEMVVTELEADSDPAIYGEAPHRPGDHWDVDLKALDFYAGIKSPSGSFKVEFVEVKEIDGIKCAVIKTSFDLQGEYVVDPGIKRKIKGEAEIERSLADLADMKMNFTSKVTHEGEPSHMKGTTMKMEGPFKGGLSATREKKP
ncbi:hypothetical protein [Haloferula sp. BvORR071]|uniref:hypothetical protein n=1 Tax=Haloferula sp. BvORR071 TaxID=1396141 RepID=UPI00054DB355|nr:hypothetical protein [Haloferula sp. BvORR071]